MILVYLAGPITKGNQFNNVHNAIVAAKRLRDAGFAVLVPHRCALDEIVLGEQDYEKWMEEDFEYIRRSDVLVRLPGVSSGSDREVAFAYEQDKLMFLPPLQPSNHRGTTPDSVAQAIMWLLYTQEPNPTCTSLLPFPSMDQCGKPADFRIDRSYLAGSSSASHVCSEHLEQHRHPDPGYPIKHRVTKLR